MNLPSDFNEILKSHPMIQEEDELSLGNLLKKSNRGVYHGGEWIKFSGSLGREFPRNTHPRMRPQGCRIKGGYWS